ncbi:hypothetical protein [Pseudovibrio denitrificans]|uniref:hypothetical protein n=1 Tax=Pseudovibrio denitrificans TaxID=258256 RepID=UPI001ABF3155|nr:hypothetical protein [Pseudovibrio denitrificans]
MVVRHLSFKDAANDTRISIECVMGTRDRVKTLTGKVSNNTFWDYGGSSKDTFLFKGSSFGSVVIEDLAAGSGTGGCDQVGWHTFEQPAPGAGKCQSTGQ